LLGLIMNKVDVIAIQETHGDSGDSAALSRIFPGWRFWESTADCTVGGGTVFAVRRAVLARFLRAEHTVLVPGRVHAIALVEDNGQRTVFVNLHISPSLGHPGIRRLLSGIARFVAANSYRAAVFILGDFNYLEADDSRYHASSGKFTRDSNTLPLMFNNIFPEFIELAQPDFTRAGALATSRL
jgi:endonuclease/exonuclease/phosphatase (EEP) superfamily protein YafD